jgi:Fe-S cluster assembly protein SufD
MKERKKAWDRFESIGLPRPKQEAFQYLTKKLVFPKPAERKTVQLSSKDEAKDQLVFVDGFFDESLSKVSSPLVCLGFEVAFRSYGLFLQSRLAKILNQETDPFAALNGAFQGRGAFLYIPPKCKAVVDLIQIYTSDEMASPRLHIYLGRNAELHLAQNSKGSSGFSNSAIDFVLDSGSSVSWIDHSDGHFQAIRSTLKRDSKLKAVFLGKHLRTSIRTELAEENAEVELYGLAHLEGDAESHFNVNVEHEAPHTRSRQHFKSVLKAKSRFSFEGKIHVLPVAQKTEAYQLNNNLILSEEASANAKPNLEIFADDVKASHGATVGQLNEEELFYLRSRGLGLEQAREWLIEGFCKEILDHAR